MAIESICVRSFLLDYLDFIMKILVIARNYDLPEANVFAKLNRSGCQVTALGSSSSKNFCVLQNGGVELGNIEFSGRISIRAVKELKRWFGKRDWDIVHFLDNRALSNGLIAGYSFPAKFVAYRGVMGHLSKWDPTSWMSYLNTRIDKIICVCDAVREYLNGKGVDPHKTVTIYKGHDVSWYDIDESRLMALRSELKIPQETVVFNCTGRLRPVKGAVYLVKAFKKLRELRPNVALLLVGEVTCEALKDELHDAPGVHELGFRTDASDILSLSDVTCLTSITREGLPKSIIEGMCRGLPALCTKVGGMTELVTSETGLLVEEGNIDEILEAMIYYVDNPEVRRAMGNAAKARISEDFNIDQTVAQTKALYEQLLSR